MEEVTERMIACERKKKIREIEKTDFVEFYVTTLIRTLMATSMYWN